MRVAVVLGAAVWPDGTASPTLRLRTLHAVSLWKSGQVMALCLTGGTGDHGAAEAQVAAGLARRAGVPEDCLLLETASRTTVENLAFAEQILPEGASVVLVTNRWHAPRAWLAARILGLSATTNSPKGTMGWSGTMKAALREGLAAPLTLWRASQIRWARRSAR